MPHGLSERDIAALRRKHGWNELPETPPPSPLVMFARQFTDLLVLLLIGAAAISLLVGELADFIAIIAVVLLNAILGFVQEWRAETTMQSLRKMLSPTAVVLRDGMRQSIPARELLPGDLIVLAEGDRVPADGDLFQEAGLMLDESVLTGESVPVSRSAGEEVASGTTVLGGHGEATVTAIGQQTRFGRIAMLASNVRDVQTQLQRELHGLARQLGLMAIAVAAMVMLAAYLTARPLIEVFMLGLSLAVAMVPEGLPAVVTVTLALGAGAMARQKALVRNLQAVETLGAASVICTDKTGTLTENKMTVRSIRMLGAAYEVTGNGYDPAGHIARDGDKIRAETDSILARLCHTALICSHARLLPGEDGWEMIGEPTEGALVTMAAKAWAEAVDPSSVAAELPFSSERKRMSVLERMTDGLELHCKGAPEQILSICDRLLLPDGPKPMGQDERKEIAKLADKMARDGLRLIALAYWPDATEPIEESGLIFLGLVGMEDPPRAEVRDAVALAARAGIRTLMITGDHPATAQSIAGQLGIPADRVLTSDDLEGMDETALRSALAGPVAFARVRPADKLRIVAALQADGAVVAMTGDGVNDAPALKKADIGLSMGIRGTEVAKDASDLVLLDDNYASIVRAVREGRRQFENIRKFVRYLLSSNTGEVVALMANLAIGGPLIFLPTQILWMNLVTDGVTAVALGVEKSEPGQMEMPPRDPHKRLLGLSALPIILAFGLYTGGSSLWIFYTLLDFGPELARTAAFTGMVIFEKASVFAFRSLRDPCWKLGWGSNPMLWLAFSAMVLAQLAAVYWAPLQAMLHTVPLGLQHWGIILTLALPLIVVPEIVKSFGRKIA
ncbi:cation-translocating P-type ATPase [Aliiruegeria sabulilitoris]|uniref:cation-translocating P-type ATPase n=1 Tax=Aliiruegeria sabulilitoris TaxID=1510458 RepID=UPI0008361B28|nr:cation-transporting P-type ATPase [Aliiruegeria sabulilitoris]NDR54923.1 cation-transporting P-type ATPase [Pseudoruegeria sp. M32A2M]